MSSLSETICMSKYDVSDNAFGMYLSKGNKYMVDSQGTFTDDKGNTCSIPSDFIPKYFTTLAKPQPKETPMTKPTESFSEMVQRLKSSDYQAIADRMVANEEIIDLQHAAEGLQTESAELTDMLKRHTFYGTPLDFTNGKEEIGDILFYAHLAANAMGFTVQECEDAVTAKLKKRFPDGFTNDAAVNRDLGTERDALEGKLEDKATEVILDLPTDLIYIVVQEGAPTHWTDKHVMYSNDSDKYYGFDEAGQAMIESEDYWTVRSKLEVYSKGLK